MSDTRWWLDSTIYHIYPLGYCGAPQVNDHSSDPVARLRAIGDRLGDIASMGFSGIYLGPVFESTSHGYDTVDYCHVDRRLGTDSDLSELVEQAHSRGIRVLLDGVFNHVGREFWAFTDVRERGAASPYAGWFTDLDFTSDNRYGDGFSYAGWEGTDTLVSLNHQEPGVRDHLLKAVEGMIDRYNIDGLRLDVAYLLPRTFLQDLRRTVDATKEQFILLGEVIHGDYSTYLGAEELDSVTNYQVYKALWSAHNDGNYFELAHTVGRQAEEAHNDTEATSLYTFADNHDVDRIASRVLDPGHLYPLYTLLFTLPGVPSVYYGSEWGHLGRKSDGDASLRPAIPDVEPAGGDLYRHIQDLVGIRHASDALRYGTYEAVHISATQFAFLREHQGHRALVAVNADPEPARLQDLPEGISVGGSCLFSGDRVDLTEELAEGGLALPAYGSRIIELE